MKSWYYLFKNGFTPAECEVIKATCEPLPVEKGKIGHGGTTKEDEMRRSGVSWLDRKEPHTRFAFDRLALFALEANERCFFLSLSDLPQFSCGKAQYTRYGVNDHYDWHEDNSFIVESERSSDRKLSCVVQLTDPSEYEGGRLHLERSSAPTETFRDVGDVIIFPSFQRHRVEDVTRGERRSLVLWFFGPPLA